jgi:hypothetical protein
LASSCRTFSFSVRRRARMLVLDSAGICIPKEKPQQGRQGFWKRTPLGGMGVRRIRFTAAFSMPKSFRLAISGQRFVSARPTTQIALDRRELVKAGAAPMPRVRARNDRIRTMIEGERPLGAALRWQMARTQPFKALLQRAAVIDHDGRQQFPCPTIALAQSVSGPRRAGRLDRTSFLRNR